MSLHLLLLKSSMDRQSQRLTNKEIKFSAKDPEILKRRKSLSHRNVGGPKLAENTIKLARFRREI